MMSFAEVRDEIIKEIMNSDYLTARRETGTLQEYGSNGVGVL